MAEPQARMARILQPIRDVDAIAPSLTTDRGTLAHNPAIVDIAVIASVATAEECDRILQIAQSLTAPGKPADMARIPRHDQTLWIYERAAEVFENANRTYRFRVVGLIEELMVAAYGPGDTYPWQVDCSRNFTANRKLSLSLLLTSPSAPDEAMPEFAGREVPRTPFAKGTAIVYPSFLAYRARAANGTGRAALHAYAYGPTFE